MAIRIGQGRCYNRCTWLTQQLSHRSSGSRERECLQDQIMLASHCLLPVPRRHPYGIGCALVWITAMLILTGGPSEAAETGRDGLVLEYKFEADAKDSSGNARHGTTIGKPRFVAGKSGQCIELDGQQDYVDCGTTLADLGQTFTVECWINPADRQNL